MKWKTVLDELFPNTASPRDDLQSLLKIHILRSHPFSNKFLLVSLIVSSTWEPLDNVITKVSSDSKILLFCVM